LSKKDGEIDPRIYPKGSYSTISSNKEENVPNKMRYFLSGHELKGEEEEKREKVPICKNPIYDRRKKVNRWPAVLNINLLKNIDQHIPKIDNFDCCPLSMFKKWYQNREY
jgi:hypothetical protein